VPIFVVKPAFFKNAPVLPTELENSARERILGLGVMKVIHLGAQWLTDVDDVYV